MSNTISGVRGIGSLLLLPLELEADVDPPLRIPEVRTTLPWSPEFAPCCRRGANLFWCSTELFHVCVPPPSLMGYVGGSGMTNLRRVAPVGVVPPGAVVPAAAAPSVGALVSGTPLPPVGISVVGACGLP